MKCQVQLNIVKNLCLMKTLKSHAHFRCHDRQRNDDRDLIYCYSSGRVRPAAGTGRNPAPADAYHAAKTNNEHKNENTNLQIKKSKSCTNHCIFNYISTFVKCTFDFVKFDNFQFSQNCVL